MALGFSFRNTSCCRMTIWSSRYCQISRELPVATRTFQAAYEAHDNRLLERIIVLILTVPHLLTTAESIPKQPKIIEMNHGGKGRKPNGFFARIWMQANTRRKSQSCSTMRERSITKTTHSKFSGSTSIKKKSVASFWRNTALVTRTNRTKLVAVVLPSR